MEERRQKKMTEQKKGGEGRPMKEIISHYLKEEDPFMTGRQMSIY
jgi:hypothetical protein